jgi:putative ABC transport system ATP-binding protein
VTLIRLEGVAKDYQHAVHTFAALKNIDLTIAGGEFVAIVGKSGSGKSTLLNMISGIDRPTAGIVKVGDTTLTSLTENQMAAWRGRSVGIVFQFFQLLPTLTIVENVMLPMELCRVFPKQARREQAIRLLQQVDMLDHASKLPSAISGGQQQRAAIARALANHPPIILADEPTGNLDSATATSILHLFTSLVKEGRTIVVATHDLDIATHASRAIHITDGAITFDSLQALHGSRSSAEA